MNLLKKTLKGVPLEEVPALLDKPLPPEAYKKIPGGADLTDISASWTLRIFNHVFGPYGIGWGFRFHKEDIEVRHESVERRSGQTAVVAQARVYGMFWYKLQDGTGVISTVEYPVTGANKSENGNEGWALKGSITNAIGYGAHLAGFQESVYLGVRSHNAKGAQAAPLAPLSFPNDPEPTPKVEDHAPASPPAVAGVEAPDTTISSGGQPPVSSSSPASSAPAGSTTPVEPVNPTPAPAPTTAAPAVVAPAPVTPPVAPPVKFRGVICLSCAWEKVFEGDTPEPPACPGCGVVAEKAFVRSPSQDHFRKMSDKVNAKVAEKNRAASENPTPVADQTVSPAVPVAVTPAATSTGPVPSTTATAENAQAVPTANAPVSDDLAAITGKRELQGILKELTGNDRGLILSALSKAASRTVTRYSDATVGEHKDAIMDLRSSPPASPASPAQKAETGICSDCRINMPLTLSGCPICNSAIIPGTGMVSPVSPYIPNRQEQMQVIFKLATNLGFASGAEIVKELGALLQRSISSSADLTDEEMLMAYRTFAHNTVLALRGDNPLKQDNQVVPF